MIRDPVVSFSFKVGNRTCKIFFAAGCRLIRWKPDAPKSPADLSPSERAEFCEAMRQLEAEIESQSFVGPHRYNASVF